MFQEQHCPRCLALLDPPSSLRAPARLTFLPPPEMPFSFLTADGFIHPWASSSCHQRNHPHPPHTFPPQSATPPPPGSQNKFTHLFLHLSQPGCVFFMEIVD